MEDQQILENINTEYLTLPYSDQVLDSHPEQLSNECTDIILASDQTISCMAPLNDMLLGQTFIIETNEQPLFVNGTQLITFQNIDSNEQTGNIQTISTIGSEKQTIQCINFTTDHFQDIYSNFNKTNSSVVKRTNNNDNLKEHLEDLNETDIDITRGNYSNSTAIKILDDVAKSPTDSKGHFVCDLCLCEFHNWKFYKRHKLEHLNDKPFKCLKCLKSFNYNNNYLLHIASHLTNNLRCPQCKKEFKRIASFKSHLKIHKTEESITCNICCKIFDNQYRLDIHKESCMQENIIDVEHRNNITSVECLITCKTCTKSFPTISEYKTHIKDHKKFDSVLKKQYKLTKQMKKVHKTGNVVKKFKCDQCDWAFNKSNLLRRHMRTHTGEKPFECSFCSKFFTQLNSLNRHLLKHKGLRPFKCEFCEMNFSQKGHLINHIKRCHAVTKEATRIHKCSICSCVYNSLNALNKHLNVYHGKKTKNKNISINEQKNIESDNINETLHLIKDPSKLEKWLEEVAHELQNSDINTNLKNSNDTISTQCDLRLNLIENEPYNTVEQNLCEISSIKNPNDNETENSIYLPQKNKNCIVSKKNQDQSPTKCNSYIKNQEKEITLSADVNESIPLNIKSVSNKVSSRKKMHYETHSKLHFKTTVSKQINMSTSNLKHSDSNLSALKGTIIKADPKVLYLPNITPTIKDINVNNMQKPQPKICQFCGKHFKKNADLERHERTHTGDKPYKCDKQGCNKAFATKCSLEYHTITHLGKMKRAVCPQCNGLFATTSSMKVHMRQHTGEKPFKCPICGDAFRTSGHLHTHVIIHERKKKHK